MMLTLMFYATWYKFLLGGPMAPLKIDDAEFCNDNWWTNLLLIHNLVNRFQKVNLFTHLSKKNNLYNLTWLRKIKISKILLTLIDIGEVY